MSDLIIILGWPASGKTTLARRLGTLLGMPCLSKDDVKEALFDALGAGGRERSRQLSDASFRALLRLARTQLELGLSCVAEANWRAEHAGGVREAAAGTAVRTAQIGCRASAAEIERRFAARVRHPGHLDTAGLAEEVREAAGTPPAFLDLEGPRWVYDSERPEAYPALVRDLKIWRL